MAVPFFYGYSYFQSREKISPNIKTLKNRFVIRGESLKSRKQQEIRYLICCDFFYLCFTTPKMCLHVTAQSFHKFYTYIEFVISGENCCLVQKVDSL